MNEELKFLASALACIFVFIGCLITSLAYFEGKSKSVYLKQTQNIDIPWYQATFLTVNVVSADVKSK